VGLLTDADTRRAAAKLLWVDLHAEWPSARKWQEWVSLLTAAERRTLLADWVLRGLTSLDWDEHAMRLAASVFPELPRRPGYPGDPQSDPQYTEAARAIVAREWPEAPPVPPPIA
jgi:hypothetical protein